MAKTGEYYKNDRNIYELAVYTALLDATDSKLLYPLMGDPIREASAPAKLDLLHDKDVSLIGAC